MGPPDIQSISLDQDRDGTIDQYNVTMRIKKPKALNADKVSPLKMQQLNVVLAFDYQLKDMINLKMEGLAVMQVDAIASDKLNAGTVKSDGSIRLRQPNALSLQPD